MGGSSSSGGSTGGSTGGDNKPAKKAAPKAKAKVDNGSSKYFKKTSTPKKKAKAKAPDVRRNRTYTAPVKKTPVAKAGSPHERNRDLVRPATPIKSTAKTTPNTDNKITKTKVPLAKVVSAPPMDVMSATKGEKERFKTPVASAITKPPAVDSYSEKDRFASTNPVAIAGPLKQGTIPLGSTDKSVKDRHLALLQGYQEPIVRDKFNADTYNAKAEEGKNSENSVFGGMIKDKYRNDEVSYNQAYWKSKKEGGATQAEMAAEQKELGSKKIYSGDRAVTKEDQGRAKYILASLERSGIKPTTTTETSGLFGERVSTVNSYDIGTDKPFTTTSEVYTPTIGGFSFGDNVTKTYVNGVATYTKTNDGERTTADIGAKGDRVEAGRDPIKEIKDIDTQIKNETDPVKLKALHQRRLRLMRMNRTNTKFAGLLDDADTKRSELSIL